jgi:hypothetical protein
MLQHLAATFGGNRRFAIVLGVRSTQYGIQSLASDANVFEVVRPTVAQAYARFPDLAALLDAIPDPSVRELLLTPLVLAWIGPRARRLSDRSCWSRAGVIGQALVAIVEASHLTDFAGGVHPDVEHWLTALMLVGWILYVGFLGEISFDELERLARAVSARWAAFAESSGVRAVASPLAGFQLVVDPQSREALLARTVFFPTGPRRVRVLHREWQDFLAARYLALSISTRNVGELQYLGYTPRMCATAGELLCRAEVQVDSDLVRDILQQSRAPGAHLIAANFCALMTSSRVPMDGPAIDMLLSGLRDMGPIAQLIALAGLGYRALKNGDPSARDLRARLLPIFESCLSPEGSDLVSGSVIASIAWCYLSAWSKRFGSAPPTSPWPSCDSDAAQKETLERMCLVTEDGPRLLADHRSVQLAFLEAQYMALEDVDRPISVVHYLYHLVVARRHGAHVAELARQLPAILQPNSAVARAIRGFTLVPEVARLFETCCQIHDSA